MGEHKHYKESGKFSPVGAVLMVLATAVCGGLIFWLYLLFEGWCTIIYLNVIAAIAVSCALGFVGGKIVRAFKMRNTVVAVACAVVGFLLASYFKWALYDYNDLKKYGYELMGEYTAYDYYDELNMLFDENTDGFGDYYDFYHQTKAYDLFSNDSTGDFSDKDIATMQKKSVWQFFELDKLLGKDKKSAQKSLEKSYTMNAYDYTYDYRDYDKTGLFAIIAHPSDLWNDIKSINKEGRWSYKSSHSSRDNGSLVNGTILWIVWGSEFILLLAFLVGGVRLKSKEPFIESEDDWAEYKNLKGAYKFMVPEDIKSFKVSMEQSPYTLFDYQTAVTQFLPTYMVIDCYVSKSGNENYLTVYQQTINPKNKNPDTKVLVKNLFVDGDFMNRLYSLANFAPQMQDVQQTLQ